MKMTKQDYQEMKKALDEGIAHWGIEVVLKHKSLHLGKDVDMRFRWDLLHYSMYKIHLLYDKGLNDTHIDSALKKYIKDHPILGKE